MTSEDAQLPQTEPIDGTTAPQPGAEVVPSGIVMTPRRVLGIVIVLLVVVLVLLVLVLFRLLRPDNNGVTGEVLNGIRAELVVQGPGVGPKPSFSGPMGVAWAPDARTFYVADSRNDRICVFDRSGRFIREFGGRGVAKPLPGGDFSWEQGKLNYPTDVAVDSEGLVYVADFYNDSISVFSPEGRFVRRFPDPNTVVGNGGSGKDGKGIAVTALTVRGEKVYALDTYQVVVFDLRGRLLQQFGKPGTAPGDIDHPNGIAVDAVGTVFVADSNNNRVQAFTPEGKHLWVAGRTIAAGEERSVKTEFSLPRGIDLLGDGSLLVADTLEQQLTRVAKNGEVSGKFGQFGSAPGELNFPNDLDIAGSKVLLADRQNNRVQVVRLVEQ